jgi:hypothetical protein
MDSYIYRSFLFSTVRGGGTPTWMEGRGVCMEGQFVYLFSCVVGVVPWADDCSVSGCMED